MTTTLPNVPVTTRSLDQDIDDACRRIAPSWPLDRFLAVSPLWGWIDRPLPAVAAELGALAGSQLLMPRSYYRAQWRAGRMQQHHLAAAIAAARSDLSSEALLAALAHDSVSVEPLPLLVDLADLVRLHSEPQPWPELVVQQISQHLAQWFDVQQATTAPARAAALFDSWREALAADRGLPIRSRAQLRANLQALPRQPREVLAALVARLGLDAQQRATWFAALLHSVRGWAATCAYARWQARLRGGDDDQIEHLLAIRATWEWLLLEDLWLHVALGGWRDRLDHHATLREHLHATQQVDWLLQHALELAQQEELQRGLQSARSVATAARVQAVFCIDVRSERLRRALEQGSGDAIHTRGFAGFFGLPVEFSPLGSPRAVPHLPGLLAPQRRVTQGGHDAAALAERRQRRLAWRERWRGLRTASGSAFTFVESCGLAYAAHLLRDALGFAKPCAPRDAGLRRDELATLRPRFNPALPLAERIALARGVLGAMGLTRDFARLVLLVGHGSSSTNNPHATALDCGACGGQSGEVSARLLAQLLADPEVRTGLAEGGIAIPVTTQFVAALHDTTTDEVRLFDLNLLPATHASDLAQLRVWLALASDLVRAERAPSLGLVALRDDAAALAAAIERRARDWAQVRPEWGLVGNWAFVVAPRSRTRHLDLGGRVFLHDYEWRSDTGYTTLTLILTAPMLVTHWINLQYYTSTTDNRQFGSGDKVLHDVVGGRLGVFEGNGGDLRIGLPMQSLHDGNEFVHTPLRLSVYVEAPPHAIDGVIAQHEVVRQLVEHGWLHLFALDDAGRAHARLPGGVWQAPARGVAALSDRCGLTVAAP